MKHVPPPTDCTPIAAPYKTVGAPGAEVRTQQPAAEALTGAALRKLLADEIDRLIALLDALDTPDEDLEPSHGREMAPGELDDAEDDRESW